MTLCARGSGWVPARWSRCLRGRSRRTSATPRSAAELASRLPTDGRSVRLSAERAASRGCRQVMWRADQAGHRQQACELVGGDGLGVEEALAEIAAELTQALGLRFELDPLGDGAQ